MKHRFKGTSAGGEHRPPENRCLLIWKEGETIPEGQWLPFATIASLVGCCRQTIYLLFRTGQIRGLKLPGSPTLADLNEVIALQEQEAAHCI